jgi:hypothetical protein
MFEDVEVKFDRDSGERQSLRMPTVPSKFSRLPDTMGMVFSCATMLIPAHCPIDANIAIVRGFPRRLAMLPCFMRIPFYFDAVPVT